MASWTLSTQPSSITFSSVACDSTGMYLTLCSNATANLNNGIYRSSTYGSNWIKTTAPTNLGWFQVSSSSDGSYRAACSSTTVYRSSTYGINWVNISPIPTNKIWKFVKISDDGTVIVTAGDLAGLYVTTNSGNSWIDRSPDANGYNMLTMNSTGKYIATNVYNNWTYISSNYGISWLSYYAGTANWAGGGGTGIKFNSEGDILQVAGYNRNFALSTDSGNFFTTRSAPIGSIFSLTGDSTGKFISVGSQADGIVNSTNYGNSWSSVMANTTGGIWYVLVSNSTGKNLYGIQGSTLYSFISESYPTITPAATQTVTYPTTTSATVTPTSNSTGAFTFSLQAGFPTGTTINSSTGVVTIGGIGTINVLVKQAASGIYAEITTPVAAGTINITALPTITPAATQSIIYGQTTTVTVTPTSNSTGAFTFSLQAGFPTGTTINSTTGVVTIGNIGTINVLVTQAASGSYAAITTPTLAGIIYSQGPPTITRAATQTIAYGETLTVTVTPTSNSSGAFTYSLAPGFTGCSAINSSTGVVSIGGFGTINVLVTQAAGNIIYTAVTTPVAAGTIIVNYSSIPCFAINTKILTIDGYRPIQDLRKGDSIKTLKNNYVPINKIGYKNIHCEKETILFDKIYRCSKENYPEVFEDLHITGLHCILVDELTEKQNSSIKDIYNDIYITDNKYRLPACFDERAIPCETESEGISIFHLALDHENEDMNYGIYANGLLVETTSIKLMNESCLISIE